MHNVSAEAKSISPPPPFPALTHTHTYSHQAPIKGKDQKLSVWKWDIAINNNAQGHLVNMACGSCDEWVFSLLFGKSL
jgi:hypothetical protein